MAESDGAPASEFDGMLHSRGYLGLLLVSALVGIPISAIAFGFLAAVHKLEHVVWHDLPTASAITSPRPGGPFSPSDWPDCSSRWR